MTSINKVLEIARHAPSVHNSQPWKVSVHDDYLKIFVDENYVLDAGDPTGRELWISMGIFAEYIIKALENSGFSANLELNGLDSRGFNVKYSKSNNQLKHDSDMQIDAMINRHSCRLPYEKYELSEEEILQLEKLDIVTKTSIKFVDNLDEINWLATLHSKAIRLSLTLPAFRKELSKLIAKKVTVSRGIQAKTLTGNPLSGIKENLRIKTGTMLKSAEDREFKAFSNSSAVLLIFSSGDTKNSWFDAGRTYARLIIEISRLGLSAGTSAGPVEASSFHEEIEEKYNPKMRLQSMIRIGKINCNHENTPRISVEELTT